MNDRLARSARIVVVDDQPIAQLGLRTLIEQEGDLALVSEATDCGDGLREVEKHRPHLVILDIAIEGDRGLEFIQAVKDRTKVLVFSLREETLYAERCLKAGAKGYVSKREPAEAVRQAIRRVLDGGIFVSDRVNDRLLHRMLNGQATVSRSDLDLLSDREREVFELLGQGATTREIAEKLKLSIKTVQTYHVNIRRSLKLDNYNQLVRRAVHYVLEGQ